MSDYVPQKGDRIGEGILTYIHPPSNEQPPHVCSPPAITLKAGKGNTATENTEGIPRGSVWWCLICDYQWVLERSAWKKWRKGP
jgi:hypothetical protein